jgi:hypothetical protein
MTGNSALRLYTFEPDAGLNDPRWQGRLIWQRIVVRERSEAFARLAAERYALTATGKSHGPGNESPSPIAGPSDVKLYKVHESPAEDNDKQIGVIVAERMPSCS